MLRHSPALKWYTVGKLLLAARLGHPTDGERRDFREQFGVSWHLVQTMLGHSAVEPTKDVYLEPFRSLDVEVLLAHADGFPVEAFMAEVFTGHPRVLPIRWRRPGERRRAPRVTSHRRAREPARTAGRRRRPGGIALLPAGRQGIPGPRLDLTLTSGHRRGHGALCDGLNRGRIEVDRLCAELSGLPLPGAADGRIVLAVDVSPWLRSDAPTSAERLFCHVCGRAKSTSQFIPGRPYSFVAALESGRTSWTAVLDAVVPARRTTPPGVSANQLRDTPPRRRP